MCGTRMSSLSQITFVAHVFLNPRTVLQFAKTQCREKEGASRFQPDHRAGAPQTTLVVRADVGNLDRGFSFLENVSPDESVKVSFDAAYAASARSSTLAKPALPLAKPASCMGGSNHLIRFSARGIALASMRSERAAEQA
jgi:hypothetical protein